MRPLLILNEIIIVLFGLAWGSFLNVIAYRILYDQPFFTVRSYCPTCKGGIAWYDNIPLFSWVILRGKCRLCQASISWLYPFIEVLTAFIAWSIFFRLPVEELAVFEFDFFNQPCVDLILQIPTYVMSYELAYGFFFSALIIAVRTDFEAMVIPQLFSICLVPVGIICAGLGLIPISLLSSITGACFGYGILWIVAKTFTYLTGKDGIGVGDMELLALIGSFTGPSGVWISLMLASIIGTLCGGIYLAVTGQGKTTKLPFGPFLVLGTVGYVLFASSFLNVLLN